MPCKTLFIIPLKSAKTSGNWEMACRLLNRTLTSIEAQKEKSHHTFIICNEEPKINANTNKTTVLSTDISPSGIMTEKKGHLDKQQKIYFGLIKATTINPEYVMIMDADDLLHRGLLTYCSNQSDYNGFIINKGYRQDIGRNFLTRILKFYLACGSNAIFPYERDYFVEYNNHTRDFANYYMTIDHHNKSIVNDFKKLKIEFKFIPFYAAIYVRGHGDSIRDFGQKTNKPSKINYKKRILGIKLKIQGRILGRKKITTEIMDNFKGLEMDVK
jgi:hypothetical protein